MLKITSDSICFKQTQPWFKTEKIWDMRFSGAGSGTWNRNLTFSTREAVSHNNTESQDHGQYQNVTGNTRKLSGNMVWLSEYV